MGLDTSHDAWHGAYSAFSRWRDVVARSAGYQVARIEGEMFKSIQIDWGHIEPKNYQGEWDETPADALIVLIAHSDCDGVIHPEQAAPLADRLEELLPLIPDEEGGGHIAMVGGYREATKRFIAGLRRAVEAGEDLDFH